MKKCDLVCLHSEWSSVRKIGFVCKVQTIINGYADKNQTIPKRMEIVLVYWQGIGKKETYPSWSLKVIREK